MRDISITFLCGFNIFIFQYNNYFLRYNHFFKNKNSKPILAWEKEYEDYISFLQNNLQTISRIEIRWSWTEMRALNWELFWIWSWFRHLQKSWAVVYYWSKSQEFLNFFRHTSFLLQNSFPQSWINNDVRFFLLLKFSVLQTKILSFHSWNIILKKQPIRNKFII